MQTTTKFPAVIEEQDLGHHRKKVTVTNTDTGEVVLEHYSANIEAAFISGANAVIAQVVLGRETLSNGHEFITASDYDHTFDGKPKQVVAGWRKVGKPPKKSDTPKHTGGKPSYFKVMTKGIDKLAELDDAEIGFLMKLSRMVNWKTGVVVDTRTKKPVTADEIARLTSNSRTTTYRRLNTLKQAQALTATPEGHFILSRDYVQKG